MRNFRGVFFVISLLTFGQAIASTQDPIDIMKGKGNCYQCHRDNEKFIGPSFSQVQERYAVAGKNPALIKHLAGRIINGGLGAWGNTPMNSNPQLSTVEAEKVVKWILEKNYK